MRLQFAKQFEKDLKKLSKKQRLVVNDRIRLFTADQFHPLLNNHALRGSYQGYRSINVSGDLRMIYYTTTAGDVVFIFVRVGTHSELYS